MNHVGTILVIGSDLVGGGDVCVRLRAHGYDARHVSSQDEALSSFIQERHEVVLVLDSDARSLGIVAALRAAEGGRSTPMAIVASGRDAAFDEAAEAAGCDDFVTPPLYDAKLLAHLRPLVRLATIRTELDIRAGVAQEFGTTVMADPEAAHDEPIKALLVGNCGTIGAALAGAQRREILDPLFAIDILHEQPFDLAVLALGSGAEGMLDLCLRIRNSPSLFNLPVLVAGPSDSTAEMAAYDHGASAYIDMGSGEQSELVRVRAMVRRHKLRRSLSRALASTLTDRTRETSRAYSPAFMAAYFPARYTFAQTFGRRLTLAYVHTVDIEKARRRFGEVQAGDMHRALSEWIALLTRIEDLVVGSGDQEFAVILPDTPRWEAAAVVARLSGIIGHVEFALTDVYEAIRVSVGVSGAEARPGEAMADFMARAQRELI